MFRPASSTVPVTAAADQIEGGCAPAPAAHAVTSNAVMSDVRSLGIRFHLSCQRLADNRDREGTLRSVRRRCKRIASAACAGRYVRSDAVTVPGEKRATFKLRKRRGIRPLLCDT